MMDKKVLVVSKPIFNNIMPLVDFPSNKDVFNIDAPIESIMGEANVASFLLGKYGMNVYYTGITGNDEAGNKFRKVLESSSVDIKFMETDFNLNTDVCHTIINTEKGGYSHIKVNSMKNDLTKFKYDFTPDYIVFDDKDFSGANAALNNYPNVPAIFYGKYPNKDAINMCKRANYIVCNINFASKLTGLEIELKKPKTIVNLYQKLIDLYSGEWIITLGEYGVIYCNNNNVKMIPGLKVDVLDNDKAGSVFFGIFAYSIISGMDIENAVRLANMGASSSLNTIGATNGIMELNELLKYKVDNNVTEVQNNEVVTESVPNAENIQEQKNDAVNPQIQNVEVLESVASPEQNVLNHE